MSLGLRRSVSLLWALALGCGTDAASTSSDDTAGLADMTVSPDAAIVDEDLPLSGSDGSAGGDAEVDTNDDDSHGSDAGQSDAEGANNLDASANAGVPLLEPGAATFRPGGLLVRYFPGEKPLDLSGPLPSGGELELLRAVDLTPDTGSRARFPKAELLIAIDGGLEVKTAGVYRLVLMVSGAAQLSLAGYGVVDVADGGEVIAFDRRVELSQGWYPLSLRIQRDVLHPHLQLFFGPEGALLEPLAGAQLGYSEAPPPGTPDLAATLQLDANGARWARLRGATSLPASLRLDWTGSKSGSLALPDATREHSTVIGLDAGGSYGVTGTFTDLWDRVVTTDTVSVTTPSIPTYRPGGLLGEYFQGGSYKTFETQLAARLDGPVDMPNGQDGNTSGSFRMDMAVDKFAIRWVGGILLPEAGLWTFIFTADDGNRLYLDDELMDENWNDHGMEPVSTTVNLPAGWHPIRLEMYEQGGGGGATFEWDGPNTARALVPGTNLGAAVSDKSGNPSATLSASPGESNGTAVVTVAPNELASVTVVLTSPGLNDVVLPVSSPTTSYRWSGTVPTGKWTATASLTDLAGNKGTATTSLTVP